MVKRFIQVVLILATAPWAYLLNIILILIVALWICAMTYWLSYDIMRSGAYGVLSNEYIQALIFIPILSTTPRTMHEQ